MLNRGFYDSAFVNCLLGLDGGGGGAANNSDSREGDAEASTAANCRIRKSFGSTSSSPSLANLPPIRVHVEDGGGSSRGGNRAQDQKVGIGAVCSDDERSDHGGYRKLLPPQPQQQSLPPQSQPKSTEIFDLPSPDSVSIDHSLSNAAISRPKPVIYQEPVAQILAVTPTRF
ncbi:hypothetical protein ABKV19_025202 [Rosa sericea]